MERKHVEAIIKTARRRINKIPGILEKKEVYKGAKRWSQNLLGTLAGLLVSEVEVAGIENIDKAGQLSPEGLVILIGNHHSNADTPIRREGFKRVGRKDIPDNTTYLAGLNVAESSPALFPSENAIQVVSPRDIEAAKDLVRKNPHQITPEQKELIKSYLKWSKDLSGHAALEVTSLRGTGKFLFLYPEATRSRDPEGRMGRGHYGLQGFFGNEQDVVVPIFEDGAHLLMPPQKPWFKVFGREIGRGWIRPRRRKIAMIVGEPMKVADLRIKSQDFFRKEVNIVDMAMFQIWKLAPERVSPEFAQLQEKLTRITA